jgi:hypothetical protein
MIQYWVSSDYWANSMEQSPFWNANSFSDSRNSQHFMEVRSSLSHLQAPATYRYPEPDKSSSCLPVPFQDIVLSNVGPCHHGMECCQVRMEEGPSMWRVAVNILNIRSRTADSGWSFSLGSGEMLTNPHHRNVRCNEIYQNIDFLSKCGTFL